MFGLYNMFTGGQLSRVTIFALGVMPYISASIILQLLTVVWPTLERISKEGELGRRKITQYTRYLTLVLAVVQALSIAVWLERQTQIAGGLPLVYNPGWGFRFMCVLTLTTGTMFVMWLGEQITERGVGNGMSLIIFAGIVVGLPSAVITTFDQMRTGQISLLRIVFLLVMMVAVVGAIVFVERGHRRITVQYAKRVVGRRQYGGSSTHIPLKVNTGGVIPVIFASSILAFPATIGADVPGRRVGPGGVRPARDGDAAAQPAVRRRSSSSSRTSTRRSSSTRMTSRRTCGSTAGSSRVSAPASGRRSTSTRSWRASRSSGAVYLAMVALLPDFLITGFKVEPIPFIGPQLDAITPQWITNGLGLTFYFGGTSLLIVVGVAMDTVQQVESQLIMRHYDGFMKKTRIRGRRG